MAVLPGWDGIGDILGWVKSSWFPNFSGWLCFDLCPGFTRLYSETILITRKLEEKITRKHTLRTAARPLRRYEALREYFLIPRARSGFLDV